MPCASRQDRRLNWYLWALLVVTNLVDVLATRRAFDLAIPELNPTVEMLISGYGIAGVAAFKALWLLILLVLIPYIRGWTQNLLKLACGTYLVLTVWHISHLPRLL